MKQPPVVFTNGEVSLGKDLIFGVVLLTEHGWLPWSEIPEEVKVLVRRSLSHNPTCPEDIRQQVYAK